MSSASKAPGQRARRRSTKVPTLSDVAREAGVSPMTVSRVINREASVVAATRTRVEEAIARIGYVPNQAARALAGGQQCRIALLHDNPSENWLSAVLVACLDRADDLNAQLLVERSDDPSDSQGLVRHLKSHRIDGVILPPPLCDDGRLLAGLRAANIEMVLVASGDPPPTANAVGIDDRRAAFEMTGHLIAAGHRRIGFVSGNPNQSASELRRAGYVDALTSAGVAPDPELIAPGDYSFASGLVAAEHLLSLDDVPTAIFASNDDMAAAVISVAHRRRLAVPDMLSVCGFDDTAIATMVWPELSTVRQPISEMSGRATELLVTTIRAGRTGAPPPPRQLRLNYEIVPRRSVKSLPAG